MSDADIVEAALARAVCSHRGQRDKAGAPYVLHPLRMMMRMSGAEEKAVALLHDVVEDCGVTLDDLRAEGFPERIIEAVDAMTRRAPESYEAFIERAAANPIARAVKLADIEDNLDLLRMQEISNRDIERLRLYRRAHRQLEG